MGAIIGIGFASSDIVPWTPSNFTLSSPSNQALGGYTVINKIPTASGIREGASKIRISIVGPTDPARSVTLSATTISNAATSGDAWDSAASPATVTWGGSNSVSLQANQQAVSDAIGFTATGTVLIAFNVSNVAPIAGTTVALRRGTVSGVIFYSKAASAEAGSADRTGYSGNSNRMACITRIEFA
jgi:hypothetical protein